MYIYIYIIRLCSGTRQCIENRLLSSDLTRCYELRHFRNQPSRKWMLTHKLTNLSRIKQVNWILTSRHLDERTFSELDATARFKWHTHAAVTHTYKKTTWFSVVTRMNVRMYNRASRKLTLNNNSVVTVRAQISQPLLRVIREWCLEWPQKD